MSDGNLAVQLSALRKALADAGGGDKLIVTLPNRRYQFVGEVDEASPPLQQEAAAAPPPPITDHAMPPSPGAGVLYGRRPNRLLQVGLGVALTGCLLAGVQVMRMRHPAKAGAPRLSLVVLPFRNASADRSQDYLADAITDDLTASLAHIPASTVIARQSADAVGRRTPQEIGRDLAVRYIVAGSITQEEDHDHIVASLIDATTGRQLWTTQFDPPRDHIADVRRTIVSGIAAQLNVAIDAQEGGRKADDRPDDPDALDLFFRARSILDAHETLSAFQAAHTLLGKAVAKQPGFIDAQAELGWMLLRQVTTLSDPNEAADLQEARTAISQALTVSPQNTRAIAARALEQEIGGDCLGAQQNAARALALEPSSLDARRVLASCAQTEMRFDDAVADYEGILQLDPADMNNAVIYLILGTLRLVQGMPEPAIRYLTLAKDEDAAPTADLETPEQAEMLLIAAHDIAGKAGLARTEYRVYASRYPGRSVWRIGSYFDAAWLKSAGLRRALSGLQDAGMPLYQDENESGIAAGAPCQDGAFAPTPQSLPGGRVSLTPAFAELLAEPKPPLVIDLGLGIASEPDWAVYNHTSARETELEFALRVIRESGAGVRHRAIAVVGEGVRGCKAFQVSTDLIRAGYETVIWYRGGEEAWHKHRSAAISPLARETTAH